MNRWIDNLRRWRDGHTLASGLALGLVFLCLLALLNVSVGIAPALRALYILPIWIATRLGGRVGGFVLVVLATLTNVWLDATFRSPGAGTLWNLCVWFIVFGVVMLLISQVENALALSERLALRDPLTGLLNRRGLETEGRDLIERAANQESVVSVIMVDCDRFKGINDRHGHRVGDDVLRFLAKTLKDNTREADVISRLGGDEFVLILDNTDQDEAVKVARRIENAFGKGMQLRGFDASLSIGMAHIAPDARDLRTLVAQADDAMYLRKERKRTNPKAI